MDRKSLGGRMRFWFVHSGDVSLHNQIVTQVSLGILSGDLAAGEKHGTHRICSLARQPERG